jgi:hypothetical protein
MAGLGLAILGGALEETGRGIAEKGKAEREAKLKMLEQDRTFAFQHQEDELSRSAAAAEAEKTRQFQLDNRQGDVIDIGGGSYGQRLGSKVIPLTGPDGKALNITPTPGYRLLTPEEITANGLDPAKAYQMSLKGDDKGKIGQIGGDGTTVNVGAEKGYDKQSGEDYAKYFKDMRDGENSGRKTMASLNVMERSMADPNFYSGSGAEKLATLKKWAVALGGDPDQVSSVESFNAMAKQATLDAMGGSLGTGVSNADRDYIDGQVPNLGNTPEGNKAVIDIQRKIAQRKIDIAKQAREYAKTHQGRIDVGFDDALSQWADANPLFPTAGTPSASDRTNRAPAGSGAPAVSGGKTRILNGKSYIQDPTSGDWYEQ